MLKEYTCIICPNGCSIMVNTESSEIITPGHCQRGQEYIQQEITNPQRNIASSILLEGGTLPLASVRLSDPIPKNKIFDIMAVIKNSRLTAPVVIGQVAIKNILGLNADVIVTKNIPAK